MTLTRTWFALLVVTQLAFIAVLPAGLGNDEAGHLIRMWALTDGHFHCDKMPQAVRIFEAKVQYSFRHHPQPYAGYWRDGLTLRGAGELVDGSNYACGYFPLALALPAAVTRMTALDWHGHVRPGGVFVASYAARLANLVVVDVALWFFLQLVPWAAFLALGFFSIPMAIEQSVSVGHDGGLFALCLLILITAARRDDRRGVLVVTLAVTAMTLIKPVFAGMALIAWPMLARLRGWRRLWLALAAVPPLAWTLWYHWGEVASRQWRPRFTDPGRQLAGLADAGHALRVLGGYLHYLVDDGKLPDFVPHRINGVWNTFFFANLWIDLPVWSYLCAAAGLGLALAASALSPLSRPDAHAPWWARAAAVAGVAAVVPATIFALYLIFTPVGAPSAYGVQGRYHAVPFLTLSVLGVTAVKRRWARSHLLAAAAAALLFIADAEALAVTWRNYWI